MTESLQLPKHPRVFVDRNGRWVRVWNYQKKRPQVYFYRSDYGSLEAAYSAAVEYERGLPRFSRTAMREKAYSNSQSKVVGVCPFHNKKREFAGWRAFWSEGKSGQRKKKKLDFSFFRYGNCAYHLAKDHREKMVKKHAIANSI